MKTARASRQMAFQLTEYAYLEHLKKLTAWFGAEHLQGGRSELARTVRELLDGLPILEKDRDKYKAVVLIAVECVRAGVEPTAVEKLVCWRDADGRPGKIEATVRGRPAPVGAVSA